MRKHEASFNKIYIASHHFGSMECSTKDNFMDKVTVEFF
jgi:hypothetical protein